MLRFIWAASLLFVVAALGASQAGAGIPEKAILAALQGPEGQYKVSAPDGEKDHRYKPRPGNYWVDGDRVVFECKLTHVLRGDKDGQIEFRVDRVRKKPPKVTFTRFKAGGIGARVSKTVLDALNKAPQTGKPPLILP